MASRVDALAAAYGRHVGLPWENGLAPAQRVWFAVYPKEDERRLRYKVGAFEVATVDAGKKWVEVDLTNVFSRWIDSVQYRDEYFKNPTRLAPKLPQFLTMAAKDAVEQATAAGADSETVVGLVGVAGLFGFAQVSDLVPKIAAELGGRLLVFFPGSREGNLYRLLDAREGWNYLATPITAYDEGGAA